VRDPDRCALYRRNISVRKIAVCFIEVDSIVVGDFAFHHDIMMHSVAEASTESEIVGGSLGDIQVIDEDPEFELLLGNERGSCKEQGEKNQGEFAHATKMQKQHGAAVIDNGSQVRTFGLVAGLGVGSGIFYYKALVDAHLALGLSPSILMVHADVRRVLAHAAAREAPQLASYLAGLLRQLASGGAEIASIPAFSPQVCAKELAAITPLPLVSLLDAISAVVKRRGLRRVALFGARVTIETQMFGALPDVEVVTPRPGEVDQIATIYVRVVEEARASAEDFNALRSLAHTLIGREKLDAIIFAGTDLAFVFNPENTDFPHLDGARVHLKAIMSELLR